MRRRIRRNPDNRHQSANPQLRLAFFACVICYALISSAPAQSEKYDSRHIARVDIVLGQGTPDPAVVEPYRAVIRGQLGEVYSAPRIRETLQALYDTRTVETVTVRASFEASGEVVLTFDIRRKNLAQRVAVEVVGDAPGSDNITEQDLLFKLNLLTPGTPITEQTLKNNADIILDYLRERGFYRSEVTYAQRSLGSTNDVGVTFRVTPNAQATVENLSIKIAGYKKPIDPTIFRLEPGKVYSRDRLTADVQKLRDLLKKENFLAPELDEEKVRYDPDTNRITIELSGKVGPMVNVLIEKDKGKPEKATQTALLPVLRDGTLDYSAIVEGERRLENFYQEQGYFFADVSPVCSSVPEIADTESNPVANGTNFLCTILTSQELMDHEVEVRYVVNLDRRLKLTDIRLRGTDKITIEDIKTVLSTQEANLLGVIPVFGYGRGHTSEAILEEDRNTIRSLMSELGYRQAQVSVNRGVTIAGEELIITFVVDEGPATVVTDVSVAGNTAVPTSDLTAVIPPMTGQNFSRARMRNAAQKIRELYSNRGFFDARIVPSFTAPEVPDASGRIDATVTFKIENEGKRVVIDRVLVEGNQKTELGAVRKTITLKEGELLRSTDIYSSESNLYGTDAFSRVEIKPRPAGDGPDAGTRKSDVIVSVEEQPARLATYGGGFSTDLGLNGFFDIRHVNLFGKLWQGGARVRASQRQQLVQLDFVEPRFWRDRPDHFAPLTVTALYQRDTTVTRFFRSTFDRGTFGIVQRIDDKGNPIDVFGKQVGDPTINRLAITAETNRTISRGARSILFFRYRFEDVRLYNISSLLIKDLLEPERKTRISGFGATFVRDTRRNCSVKYSLLDIIAKGEPLDPCRYNASDPTNGQYLTAEYNVSVPALGANVGFHKVQLSYNYYYSFGRLKNTTLAARAIFGAGRVFAGGDRFTNSQFPSFNGLLPISERFFAGGANNLRGFDFEEAGPRVVIMPQGTFRDQNGKQIFLDPFTVPFGGNALGVVNIEGRVPLTKAIRVVPFYDGGNVFRRASEIFKRPTYAANDIVGMNQKAIWTHTMGLGLRLKTPIGGEFGIDYGHLLNPPTFIITPGAEYRLRQSHLHFRFSQAF